ncbi:mechanosensitive ion channel domain-containing protein [Thalassobium sp. R2A62]|uniref:mechanosensitive ion channel domain-containing protein n=1 Tax=Thalassobium sp. R2A62 TaxID=633131 RepID=UPI0001B1D673|nr:mechanosensitive ion channel domain-containing protein [Thalassobium sp. R2A62]EET49252.1 MscS Mechanosensitive ion channel [Thalassobium sp. R2A62]
MRIFLTCLMLLLSQAAYSQDTTSTIAVGETVETDAATAVRIRDILSELGAYSDVTVSVNSGVVTLRGQVADATQIQNLNDLVSRVDGIVSIKNEVSETTDLVERLDPAIDRLKARVTQMITYLPLALIALSVFAIIVVIGFTIARLRQPWNRLAPNAFIAEIFRQIVRLGFVLGGLVVALDILGATALLSTILGAAGIIGLAIGFAVKDSVENFIASIMLSIRQPFRPNDAVEINGDVGKVIRLTSRATILLSFDGNHIRIPNATVFKSRIINYSRNRERRFLFEIGVASDADLAAVRTLATDTVCALPFVLKTPEPSVWIDRIGYGAIFFSVTGWVDQTETSLARAKGEALRLVKLAVEAAGIEVPDTTYRIQMLGDDAPAAKPQAPVSTQVELTSVTTQADDALEVLIEGERSDGTLDDLLRDDGAEE